MLNVMRACEVALALPSDARALPADRPAERLDPLTDEAVNAARGTEALPPLADIRFGRVEAILAERAPARVGHRPSPATGLPP